MVAEQLIYAKQSFEVGEELTQLSNKLDLLGVVYYINIKIKRVFDPIYSFSIKKCNSERVNTRLIQ